MKLETLTRDVSTAGVMSVHKATIAASAKTFDFFASQTYSDKYKAIVRELVSNALDSHAEAGNTDPVDVYLPDAFDPYFRVKDHGIGMSHDFATTSFMCYSDGSTKDGSNLVIGGFGIGSKSPFAYTDQFTLRSVHNGTASVYSVFKDEDGIPSIGLLEQKPTNEINGVEFSLPVEEDDFAAFTTAAQSGLPYFFDRVRLHGAEVDAPHFIQRGETWAVRARDSANVPQVVMGGVAYPIAYNQLSTDLRYDSRLSPLLEMPIDLFMPIGSCSVTLSRESLLYDDKTKAAIRQALESIIDEITADIPTMFDGLAGEWNACKALHEYLGGDRYQARSKLVLGHVRFKGEPLEMHFSPTSQGYEKAWVIAPRKGKYHNNYQTPNCPSPTWDETISHVSPKDISVVLIDDLPPTAKSATIKRIKTYVDDDLDGADQVLVIRPWDYTDINPALEAFGNIPPEDFILTSSLPEPERFRSDPTDKLARPNVRMFKLSHHGASQKSLTITHCRWNSPLDEIEYAYQPARGILVVMNSFELPDKFWSKYTFFERDELLFINKSDADKLKNFTQFEAEFQNRLAEQLAAKPTLAQSNALKNSDLRNLIAVMVASPRLFADIPKSKPLAKLRTLVETYVINDEHNLSAHVEAELPKNVDPDALLTSIKEKHWQFMTFLKHYDRNYIPDDSPEFNLLKELA